MKFKGGPGSGRRPEAGGGSFGHGRSNKPSGYSERPASRNPGKPRAGQRPQDLFPERYNPDGSPRSNNDPKPAPKK